MKTYNIELLYQLYKKNDASFEAMERDIHKNKVVGVPKTAEKLKQVADQNEFSVRFSREQDEKATELAKEIGEFDEKLLKITMAGIAKYAQGLQNKKWVSENGLGVLFNMYRAQTNRPAIYTKNENENSNAVTFLEEITDEGNKPPETTE